MGTEYMLKHFLATLKYRCSKAIGDVQENYPNFEVGEGVRTPIELLNHISVVLRFAQSLFDQNTTIGKGLMSWDEEVSTFYNEIEKLDKFVSGGLPDKEGIFEKLMQGPLSDAMTHVGQLAMIRRLAGDPIQSEDYSSAHISS